MSDLTVSPRGLLSLLRRDVEAGPRHEDRHARARGELLELALWAVEAARVE